MEVEKQSYKLFESFEEARMALQNNQPRLVVAGAKELCIVRNANQIRVFNNACPHMKDGLNKGVINLKNQIVCPLHGYKFDIFTGDEEANRCGPLKFVEIQNHDDGSIWLKC